MAGTIVHLAVASELNNRFLEEPEGCLGRWAQEYREDMFIAGNICPDGIMARKNYERSMKLHTHMRDGIPDGTFHQEENLTVFRERLYRFFQDNLWNPERDFSLYLGYLTHMLTDEKFILEIYNDVLEAIAAAGYPKMDKETFERFGADVDAIDFRLVREYPGMARIGEILRRVGPYEITGLITSEELTESRSWILQYFFGQRQNEIREPVFLPYQRMFSFIAAAVDEICVKLPAYISI